MMNQWNEQDITETLRKMAERSAPPATFERVWFKVEEKLAKRKSHLWGSVVWRPWSHPVRWVMAAACLCFAFVGILDYRAGVDQSELASYVISVSNPAEGVTRDLGIVNVSTLLSEPSSSVADLMEDVHVDPLADDQILL